MGKKRVSTLGSTDEEAIRKEKAVKLEQKKLREGKGAKAPGLKGGQRVVDTTSESLAELEVIEAKQRAVAVAQVETNEVDVPTRKRIHIRSKAYKAAKAQINVDQQYPLSEALPLLRKVSLAKFDPTVELHLTLKEKGLNKEIELPHSTGKVKKIAIADDAVIAKIESGKIDFDVLLASPAQMGKLVKLAKILGPRGLMPNPKNNTVVPDPESKAKSMAGKNTASLKTEKDAPLIHLSIGKLSAKDQELTTNIQAILSAVPPGSLRKAVLKSSISPAIKIQY